ncbi:MAG: glycosyltransferase [Ignavibacteria bacterium]|nr:glycosyltransferase [Ignavibacteria bacterium]
MKKVLFLTYYWPPSGKASLHWPLKMIKYLPQFGWQPAVLTVEDESFMQKDESMEKEIDYSLVVLKTPSIEPFEFYKIFTGKGKDAQLVASETISKENKSLAHRISLWIRMNLFIPDARIGWYPFAVKAGNRLLRSEIYDAVVSIGPPHSVHLAAAKIARNANIPFYPVFIDPWLNIAYYKGQSRSKLTVMIDGWLERRTLEKSRRAIFVTETSLADYVASYPFLKEKGRVLHWGFDEEKFAGFKRIKKQGDEKVILHSGNIFDFQNPEKLWGYLKQRIDSGENFRVWFTGTVSPGVKRSISEAGLDGCTSYLGFLSYDEMLEVLAQADYLLVCAMEKRHFPGKLFEYLRTGIPILAYGDDNIEVEGVISSANAGMMLPFSADGSEFFERVDSFKTNLDLIKNFDRKVIAGKLSLILGE